MSSHRRGGAVRAAPVVLSDRLEHTGGPVLGSTRRRTRLWAAVAVAAAGLTVAAGVPALAAQPAAQALVARPGGPFYDTPSSLPDADGVLIRNESEQTVFLGTNAQRIMYSSTDAAGQRVAVTGTVLSPTAPWTGPGERPLVTYAVGTIGQGDQCAPSILFTQGLEYEEAFLPSMLAKGVTVVVTDYIGLGTDGVHTYVNRVDEGNAVLDAARAAKQLGAKTPAVPGVDVAADGPVGIYGYSQGGGAAGAAAELAASHAPELKIAGSVVGAPPADLAAITRSADGNLLGFAVGYAINGLVERYPQLAAPVDALLNQRGRDLLATLKNECALTSIVLHPFVRTRDLTVSGQPISDLVKVEPFQSIVAAQRVGTLTPNAPVRIFGNTTDDIIAPPQVRQLAHDWCDKGATVDYAPVDLPAVFPGSSLPHGLGLIGSPAAQQWLYDRFVGAGPSENTCSTLPPV